MNSTKKLRLDSSQFFDTASRATESAVTVNTVHSNEIPTPHEDTGYEKSYGLDEWCPYCSNPLEIEVLPDDFAYTVRMNHASET